MKEEDFHLLSVLHNTRNITHTAEKLFLSQPTLSYRIKQIEKELNIQLFIRKKNNIIFTEEGKLLIKFAKQKNIEFKHFREKIKDLKNVNKGTIRIGVSTNFGLYKLPNILKQFRSLYPDINIEIFSGWSHEVVSGISNNKMQVGIITGEYEWYGEKSLLSEDPLVIISKYPLDINDLPNLSRINYEPRVIQLDKNKPFNSIKSYINIWWSEYFKEPPNIIMNIDTVETCKEMVNHNLGYSIIPLSSIKEDDNFEVIKLKSKNGEQILRNTYIIYEDYSLELPLVSKFINFITS